MKSAGWGRFAKILLLSFVISGLVSGAGWFLGWRTAAQFSNAFLGVGGILIIVGIFSIIGVLSMRSDYKVFYNTGGASNLHERNQRWLEDLTEGSNSFLNFFLVGGFLLLLAILVGKIF